MTHILINKFINDVKIAEDKKAIKFITNEGQIIAKCDGDCCSNTWIENIEMPVNGLPAKVIEVDNLEMPDLGSPGEDRVIEYYGLKIKTDKGDITIDYRNESNGYYGGNLWWPKEDPDEYNTYYGGVFGQNVSEEKWVEIS